MRKYKAMLVLIISSITLYGCGERISEEFKESIENEGGAEGVANNAKELVTNFTDALGVTERQEYVIDENTGAIVTDGNNTAQNTQNANYSQNNQIEENNIFQVGDTVTFDTENSGLVSITINDWGPSYELLYENITYIDYTVENVGNSIINFADSVFTLYGDDYKMPNTYGDHSISVPEDIESGRKLNARAYFKMDSDDYSTIELEFGGVIFILKDPISTEAAKTPEPWYTGKSFHFEPQAIYEEYKQSEISFSHDNDGNMTINVHCWGKNEDSGNLTFKCSSISESGITEFSIYMGVLEVCPIEDNKLYIYQKGYVGDLSAVRMDGVYVLDSNDMVENLNTEQSTIIEGSNYWYQEGENEDAYGADVTIGYDTNGELRITGESWTSLDSIIIDAPITTVNNDGSMIVECFDEMNEGILYIYPTKDGGISIRQDGSIGGITFVTFDGIYQIR